VGRGGWDFRDRPRGGVKVGVHSVHRLFL
jgi:hypothetical protein